MKKLKQYSVERGFISKLLEDKDFKLLKEQQIQPYFLTGENRKVFKFIQDSLKSTGEIPTRRVIGQKFPNYELELHLDDEGVEVVGTDETLLYWCKELRTKAKHNKMADITEEIAEKLDNGETEEAYALMKQGVWKIENDIQLTESVDITKDTEDRIDSYLERKKKKGMVGISSGIEHLDWMLKGFVKETLTTVIARSGVGKTFFLVLLGAYAQLNGYRVACFITEMSTDLMRDRFEAMLFGMMYGDFNYSRFKSGTLDPKTEQRYFDFLKEDLPRLEPLILETATDVSGVVSVIEKDKPDLVLVDGVYLMTDEQGAKDDWLRVSHITRDLKVTAKTKHIPIIINSQAHKSAGKKSSPELEATMFSQSLIQDSDNVLSLFRDEVMINDNEMMIRILKNREGMLGKVVINWDFNTMNFKRIYSEKEGGEDKDNAEENAVLGIE